MLNVSQQMFSARAGPSSGLVFSPDIPMPYPSLHPTQVPMLPPGLPGTGNPSDTLKRVISSQLPNMGGGYKDPILQVIFDPSEIFFCSSFRISRAFIK